MGWSRALQKNNFSGSIFFAHAWTTSNPHKINMWVHLGTWIIVFFNNLKKTEALQKINFSSSDQPSFAKKTTFQALKKCFLHTSLMKLRPAQLCKKTTFQALENHFFACLLSNLPAPPCYLTFACSKLCRCLQYKTKNALRIWGTLSLLWCKFACIKKKKKLRGPGPQAFGFFTSARAAIGNDGCAILLVV